MPEWRITEKNGDLLISVKKPWCCDEVEAKQGLETSGEKLEAADAGAQNSGTRHPPDTKKVLPQDMAWKVCFFFFFFF